MRASIWCGKAQDVRRVHAEIMDHLARHSSSLAPNLHLVSSNSQLFRRGHKHLSSSRSAFSRFRSSNIYDNFALVDDVSLIMINIDVHAGKFALWMIPQLFAYALNFPIQKFLQAQRKVMVMAVISAVVLVLHAFFSWLLILRLGWGLVGAAITLNTSWWLIVIGQLLYIFITKSDGAWNGFSWLAFSDLFGFVKLSLASAVMLWYTISQSLFFFSSNVFNYTHLV